jgi:hypothetical protein
MSADQKIPEHSVVALRRDFESEGHVLPAGQLGTVVHAWGDGKHYAVEFDKPTSQVVDVERDDIRLV